MRIASVGRHAAGWATESDLADAFVALGHDVTRINEFSPDAHCAGYDLAIYTPSNVTQTGVGIEHRLRFGGKVPVIGFHLDRWFGLAREKDLRRSLFPRCDLVITADGGHDDEWASLGADHVWLPPAIAAKDLATDEMLELPRSGIVFVGKVDGYHPEWPHRGELRRHLVEWYGRDFKHYGGSPLLRGEALTKVIASAAVVIGDSCLAGGGGAQRYWSDRVPETTGRGGVLLHPWVAGLREAHPFVAMWQAGEWDELRYLLDGILAAPYMGPIARKARDHTAAHHTWEHRAAEILANCEKRGLL